jgi:hypothetical protein
VNLSHHPCRRGRPVRADREHHVVDRRAVEHHARTLTRIGADDRASECVAPERRCIAGEVRTGVRPVPA